jgi:putative flippase GtrA
MNRTEGRRIVRFLLTGGIAAVVNVVSRWLLSFAILYELAVAVAYLIGMTTAFILARLYVFESSKNALHYQYFRFGVVNLFAFAQVWLVSVGLARFVFPAIGLVWHPETVAHVIGVASPIATSYMGHKHFSFR